MAVAVVGWEACRVEWWIDIAHALEQSGQPWPDGAALMDLRFWEGQIRLGRTKRIPSRRRLMRRWSWSDHEVRKMLKSEQWLDHHHCGGKISHNGQASDHKISQNAPNILPTFSQQSPSFGMKVEDKPQGISQQSPKHLPNISQTSPHARFTQTQTQNTEHKPACGLAGTQLKSISGDGRERLWPELVRDLEAAGYQTLEEVGKAGRDAIAADLGRSASRSRLNKIWRVLEALKIETGQPASQPSEQPLQSSRSSLTLVERYAVAEPEHQPGQAPWDLADYSGDNHGK